MFGLLEYNRRQEFFHLNTLNANTVDLEHGYNTNGYVPLAIVDYNLVDEDFLEYLEEKVREGATDIELAKYATLFSLLKLGEKENLNDTI